MAMRKTLLLKDARQVKVLAHPMRMRILAVLREEPLSPKQAAERLGEKPTRLYHHFAALERVGLIELAATRQRRGAVERLYRPVARQFRVDRALFEDPQAPGRNRNVVRAVETMFAATLDELRAGLEAGTLPVTDKARVEVGTLRLRVAPRKLPALMKRLRALLAEAQEAESSEGTETVRLTVALFSASGNAGSAAARS
jgi:DNA-binding transcriptional ArsR family regulator